MRAFLAAIAVIVLSPLIIAGLIVAALFFTVVSSDQFHANEN